MFLLRGGADIVRKELLTLADGDRADLPVLYAAVEQIADFERPVSPEETATALTLLACESRLPEPTSTWVRKVFENERSRRRMQRKREAYTTIHRDWASRLICAALRESRTRAGIAALLARDFNAKSPRPLRTIRLWSWLWYDDHGTPYIREWAAAQAPDDWMTFIGAAARAGLYDVASVADKLHLLFHSDAWKATLTKAFSTHKAAIAEHVGKATAESWRSLKLLFTTMDYACPDIAADILRQWPPARAAAALEETHPDYYNDVRWFLGGILKHSDGWCAQVGQFVAWDRMSESLCRVRPGDLDAVEDCQCVLRLLGVPLLRSRFRRFVDIMRDCLAVGSLADLRPGFGGETSFVLQYFPEEIERLSAAINPVRLGRELSESTPRHWRTLVDLFAYIAPPRTDVYQRIIDHLDKDQFVATVMKYGPSCPYELRCLLWFLSYASGKYGPELAARLMATVKEACRGSATECPELLRAMRALDAQSAERIASQCDEALVKKSLEGKASAAEADTEEEHLNRQRSIKKLEQSGEDYDLGAIFEPKPTQTSAQASSRGPP